MNKKLGNIIEFFRKQIIRVELSFDENEIDYFEYNIQIKKCKKEFKDKILKVFKEKIMDYPHFEDKNFDDMLD